MSNWSRSRASLGGCAFDLLMCCDIVSDSILYRPAVNNEGQKEVALDDLPVALLLVDIDEGMISRYLKVINKAAPIFVICTLGGGMVRFLSGQTLPMVVAPQRAAHRHHSTEVE